MHLHLRKALQDMRNNRFLNAITVATIALAVIIVGAFSLFVINAGDLLNTWRQGLRLMVYLEDGLPPDRRPRIEDTLRRMPEIERLQFISKEAAMALLRSQMSRHAALLDGLTQNPLPEAYEVEVRHGVERQMESLAERIEQIAGVEEVAYGKQWIKRFGGLVELLGIIGYALTGLFSGAAVFFVANTIRLILYGRREELEIMRLVGASERFIRTPFYIQALLQGFMGGLVGIGTLYLVYRFTAGDMAATLGGFGFSFRFLPWTAVAGAVLSAMVVGWLGCFASLKQFIASS
ncbi:MAG: permease-like cell division protein FtsX [Desulfobacterales bacterium]|jgi:cell division transport system permease protein|nr:permease-like cell division protein FtsX [Desulfobacteraceae bacterium]MDD3992684.1 permease-like cell division protein FtsX [Desulfobacteraceae bacterium]MDY0311883.1 permease-like cell division protein FtsX [Desulfobacterales bacterium]